VTINRTYLGRLGERELRALLAHEVIHIRHNDLPAVGLRTFGGLAIGLALLVAAIVFEPNMANYPIWFTAFFAGTLGGVAVLSVFNRPREARADAEGAMLSGDPAALATALTALEGLTAELRDRLFNPSILGWLLWPWSCRAPSHPPLASRLAHLRAMEVAQGQQSRWGSS
jgi:heat shock protein HtpX